MSENIRNIESKIIIRKKKLIDTLLEKKLKYTRNGLCDMYIKYGKPSINDIIDDIEKRDRLKQKRLLKLISRLNKLDFEYDNKNSFFSNYVSRGGDLEYSVEEGIMEWFYKNYTNYEELLNKYKDEDRAIFLSKINKSKIKEFNKKETNKKLKSKIYKLKVKNKNFVESLSIF
jgi:prolyl oligopeptidase PreP (S9A serine peptidase family)